MSKLSELRKKIRKVLSAILKKLKLALKAAKPVIVKALTKEVQFAVALLKREGAEFMNELDERLSDPSKKANQWTEWAKGWLETHAEEVSSEWGDTLRIRTSSLNLVREIIYQWRKETD